MTLKRILQGAIAYAKHGRSDFLKQLKTMVEPTSVMISCVDSRVFPTKFLRPDLGEMYIIRNAGNFFPVAKPAGEPCNVLATIELTCVRGNVNTIIVCGHSDCKAMHLLTSMGCAVVQDKLTVAHMSPLQKWVANHGMEGFRRFELFPNVLEFPINKMFNLRYPLAIKMDVIKGLSTADQLSQINVLQQMSHVYSHPMLTDRLASGSLQVYGFWFHVHDAQLHMFNPFFQTFVPVTEETLPGLLAQSQSG